MGRTRRETLAMIAAGAAFGSARAGMAADPCGGVAAVDRACAPLLALLPEAVERAGIDDASAARRCNDRSPDGTAAVTVALAAARAALPAACPDPATVEARLLLDRAAATADLGYGDVDPLAAVHRPYRVTAFCGPQIETFAALALWQPVDTPAALDVWQAKLDAAADALLGTARGLRADEAAGCVPPQTVARAALAGMDAFVAAAAGEHPLVVALALRLPDPAVRADAVRRASGTLAQRVQPAMAVLRDAVAGLARRGREETGVWALPSGERLYAANLARAADGTITPGEAIALGRDEAARITALLDRRLAARGYAAGTSADRLAAAFAAHPALIASDDDAGRAALRDAARDRIAAGHALLRALVPPALAATAPIEVRGLAEPAAPTPAGSFYIAGATTRPATLWLDDRSVYALPIPGVSPLAAHLGLPGAHLLAQGGAGAARSTLARAAAWPALRAGWAGYGDRLAAEQGLFARDPWGDVARLADERARAVRLVIDIGLHHERWTRPQAEQAMIEMTGAADAAAIERALALPGEAVSDTIGLHRLLDLRAAAKAAAGKRFDLKSFHAAVLTGGARPFAAVEAAVAA